MEHHPLTFWQWLNHHWAVISLVYFPAAMMYLNSLAIFLKVMGATKLADFLAKLEQALIAARNAARAYRQQNPQPKGQSDTYILILMVVAVVISGCLVVRPVPLGVDVKVSGTNVVSPYGTANSINGELNATADD